MLGSVISPIVTAIGSGRRRSDFDMHIFVICFLCVALITAVLCFINYCQWPRESARRVRELLAETPREGYPIDGFAVWRLAGRPALDVVLRGFVDCDDIRDALAVIDPTVEPQLARRDDDAARHARAYQPVRAAAGAARRAPRAARRASSPRSTTRSASSASSWVTLPSSLEASR